MTLVSDLENQFSLLVKNLKSFDSEVRETLSTRGASPFANKALLFCQNAKKQLRSVILTTDDLVRESPPPEAFKPPQDRAQEKELASLREAFDALRLVLQRREVSLRAAPSPEAQFRVLTDADKELCLLLGVSATTFLTNERISETATPQPLTTKQGIDAQVGPEMRKEGEDKRTGPDSIPQRVFGERAMQTDEPLLATIERARERRDSIHSGSLGSESVISGERASLLVEVVEGLMGTQQAIEGELAALWRTRPGAGEKGKWEAEIEALRVELDAAKAAIAIRDSRLASEASNNRRTSETRRASRELSREGRSWGRRGSVLAVQGGRMIVIECERRGILRVCKQAKQLVLENMRARNLGVFCGVASWSHLFTLTRANLTRVSGARVCVEESLVPQKSVGCQGSPHVMSIVSGEHHLFVACPKPAEVPPLRVLETVSLFGAHVTRTLTRRNLEKCSAWGVAGQAKETVREVLVGVGRFSRAAASAKREKTLDYSEMVQVLQATRNLEIVLLGKVEFPEATSWPSLLSTGNSWDSFCCRNVRLEALGLIARAEQEATVSVFMQELSHGETVRVARTREALPEDLQGVVSFSVKVQGVRAVEIGLQRRRLAISSSKRASLRLPIEEEGDFSDKFSIANLVAGDQLTVLVVGGKNVSLHLNQREVSAQAVSGSTSGYLGVVRWKGSGGFVALMPPAIAIPLETQLPASPEPHQTPLSRLTLMPSAEEDSVLGAISRNLTAALYDERHPS